MSNRLKDYFPLIRERQEILKELHEKEQLNRTFESWTGSQQEEFLNFCTGVRGVKILYDAIFKEIMNPEHAPERLNEFLSLLLKRRMKIIKVLPNDSTRLADENSLLITDIVVEMEDGSLGNIEVQKIGYLFPGERSACYSADMLLRQYKRVRGEAQKKFSYKDIKTVYIIVLYEKSPAVFKEFPNNYLHYFEQQSDTGLKMELLQKYLFVPLDIFQKNKHNENITDKLDAWLMFLSTDDPDAIIRLITAYPEFRPMYEEIYRICRNMECIMGIFSEELLELDRNTVQYMMDEMQKEIDQRKEELDQKSEELNQKKEELNQKSEELVQKSEELKQTNKELVQKSEELNQKNKELTQQAVTINQLTSRLANSELSVLIRQVRKQACRKLSADQCADILDAEPELVQRIYVFLEKFPEWDDERILSELIQ